MIDYIDSLDYFSTILQIETQQDTPNQTFDSYINGVLFQFIIRTYNSDRSTITIYENGELICEEAPFLVNMNLAFFSNKENYAFFFLTSKAMQSSNYSNLGKELRLYYGSI